MVVKGVVVRDVELEALVGDVHCSVVVEDIGIVGIVTAPNSGVRIIWFSCHLIFSYKPS